MTLQDQMESFQKLIFSHFRQGVNNECRISALVPLVLESYGIYKFITSMMRAMYRSMQEPFLVHLALANGLQLPATMKHLLLCANGMMVNIADWCGFTTNARICGT